MPASPLSTTARTSQSRRTLNRLLSIGCALALEIVRTQVLTTKDGFKWFLADGSWLLVRASGTEPLVRVYTEASTPGLRDELVVTGERIVRGS